MDPPAVDGGTVDAGPTDAGPILDGQIRDGEIPDGTIVDSGLGDAMPGDVAPIPPGLPGVVTDFAKSIEFLYGAGGTQIGVQPGVIEPARVAVLRGQVIDVSGAPLSGVTVTLLGHGEFGRTETDANGDFNFVVNGGPIETLDFQKSGYLPVQRSLPSEWQSFALLHDPVVMIVPDPIATMVNFGSASMQTHQSSISADDSGMRRATLAVPPGVSATMVMADGSRVPLAMGMVRATEYTVGERGLEAMPGELPSQSGFTYAAELSIDEALGVGAETVEFSAPLPFYVDNFLHFPAGTIVPVGHYDRRLGLWVAMPDGVAIDILGQSAGLADLDTNGDGQADDATQLASHGIDDLERATIATLWPTGGSMWRSRVPHFSAIDTNLPPLTPDPYSTPPRRRRYGDPDPCPRSGSIIGCEDQTLGEKVPILGTPFDLVYQSRAVPGRTVESRVVIPVSGPELLSLAELQAMRLVGEIAGRKIEQLYLPAPNVSFTFEWEGLDVFGRPVYGPATFKGTVEYSYQAQHGRAGGGGAGWAFGVPSGGSVVQGDTPGSLKFVVGTNFRVPMMRFARPKEASLGGWSIDKHHVYSPETGRVITGHGEIVGPATNVGPIAGHPTAGGSDPQPGPALDTRLPAPEKMLVGPDGTAYILDQAFKQLWKITNDGNISLAVGCLRNTVCPALADGVQADTLSRTSATIWDFTIGSDNRLFVLLREYLNPQSATIWRREDDGSLYRIGGTIGGDPTSVLVPPADGSLARDGIFDVSAIAAGPYDSVFFVNEQNTQQAQIMRIGADGRLSRVAGRQAAPCAPVDDYLGTAAIDACFFFPITQLAVHPNGTVYLLHDRRVFEVDVNGVLQVFAGRGAGCGAPPTPLVGPLLADICLQNVNIYGLQVGPDGQLYALTSQSVGVQNQILINRFEDRLVTIAGGGNVPGENGVPTEFVISPAAGLGFGFKPSGELLFVSFVPGTPAGKLFSTTAALGTLSGTDIVVPEKNGRVAWVFDQEGRHLSTRDLLTGAALYTFGYDAAGQVETITDLTGGVTRIERNGSGATITAPNGMLTTLQFDASGRLTQVVAPSGTESAVAYVGATELIETFTDERGRVSSYDYDPEGRLVHETTPDGGDVSLVRRELPGGAEVDFIAASQTTTYRTVVAEDGTKERAVFAPGGATEAIISHPDGTRDILAADGTVTYAQDGSDPRFGSIMPYPRHAEIAKNGRTLIIDVERTLSGGRGYFGEGSLLISGTIEGATSTLELDASMAQARITSPAGRVRARSYDAGGRLFRVESGPGVAAKEVVYDANGNVELFTFGAWAQGYEYGADQLASAITSDGVRWELARDPDGALTTITTPAGDYLVTHHEDGSLATLSLPGGMAHTFESDARGYLMSYSPPTNPAPYLRSFDVGGVLQQITRPSGRTQTYGWAADGRLQSITWPEAVVTFGYAGLADLPTTITRTPGSGSPHTTTIDYQANLPVRTTYSGATVGVEDLTYGPSFLLTNRSFSSGGDSASYPLTYDSDRRLMSYGPMSFTRNGPDRMVDTVSVGSGVIALTYSPEGKLAGRSVSVGGTLKHATNYTFGALMLPASRIDNVEGTIRNDTFSHDAQGQLTEVQRNGLQTERYTYDPRGNRLTSGAEVSTYDAQDRLLDRGGANYGFGADGFVASRATATYSYSAVGELLSATVGGVTVTYEYDGLRRLVRRTQAGQSTSFFYGDPLDLFRLSAYQAPGEALTRCFHDEWGFLVALERGGQRWIVATDLVGSPRVVIDDATGIVVKAIDRDAYGLLLSDSAPAFVLTIGFAGGIEDPQTKLVRFGMRDYEPAAGRFTARDPALLDGHHTNFYAYARSSPLAYRDPSGLFCVGGSAFAGIGGGGKFCITKDKISVCGELGFGAGVSADVQPWANVDGNTISLDAAAKAGLGPLGTGCEGSYGVNLDKIGGADPCRFLTDFDCKSSAFGADYSMIKGQEGDGVGPVDIANLVQKDAVNTRALNAKGIEIQAKASAKACGQASW